MYGMSLSAGSSAHVEVKKNVKATAEQKAEAIIKKQAAIQVAPFVRADCAVQAQVIQKLIKEQKLFVDGDDQKGEYDDVAENAEEDYDSEAEFVDDDELREDGQSFNAHVALSGGDESPLDTLPRVHEIKFVQRGTGKWSCVPPRNPLSGYRVNDSDNEARLILDAVRRQFAFYEAVANWLQSEGDDVLKSPEGFKEHHKSKTRQDFCKEVGFTDTDTTNIRAYCKKCRLAWPLSSLPLDSVFT
ncbi:MAG: hypothetical protein IKO72_13715 [Kiritimatiellae bacterium]|nr:hypothetical protein [Kiritimatiellia bacterium]